MKTRKLIAFWLVSLLSLIWFSYWDWVVYRESANVNHDTSPQTFQCNWFCCIFSTDTNSSRWNSYFTYSWNQIYFSSFSSNDYYCMQYTWTVSVSMKTSSIAHIVFYNVWNVFSSSSCPVCPECEVCQECPTCPVYNLSLAPLGWNTEYYSITWNVNVVVNDWIDYELDNHNNALWLSVWLNTEIWWQCSWDVIGSWNWSALYINDIQHESAPLINLTIPEEFERDYTNDSGEFNLWVSWYNLDPAYIDWIITTQKTLPDKQDFNNTISWLLPLFIPWLVIIACLYFIFRFIKKVF